MSASRGSSSGRVRFNIVIPTRERADVLGKCLATVLAEDDPDLRVIVSDNCSEDLTRDVVSAFADERVCYVRTGRRVSMTENWEFALSHVNDGWVSVLGDDDGLVPGALERVRSIIARTGVEAVRSAVCWYGWPSVLDGTHGRLSIPRECGLDVRSSPHWLRAVRDGRVPYTQLPVLYNGGFVSSAVLQRMRSSGRIYHSCIPDVYSGLAIASVTPFYAYSWEPLAINGASAHSTGTAVFGKASAPSSTRFMSEGNLPFHASVPMLADGRYPHSFQVLVLESYLQSAMLRGAEAIDFTFQLRLIADEARGAHDPDLRAWAHSFAMMNGLDIDVALRSRSGRQLLRRLERLPRRLTTVRPAVIEATESEPLQDVLDASLVAGRWLSTRHVPVPNPVKRAASWLDTSLRLRSLTQH